MSMSLWQMKATNGGRGSTPDLTEVRRALSVFVDPGHGFQLHAKPFGIRSYATFAASDLDGACEWAKGQPFAQGLFYALNPVSPTLENSLLNRDVQSRRWLLVDIDRNKTEQPDDPATDKEHEDARQAASQVLDYLGGLGWPSPVLVDSGNGFHLLYRVALPNDKLAAVRIKAVLAYLADKFDGPLGTVGRECHDARRIARLPGSWAKRGAQSDRRPYRMARLLHVPEPIEIVTAEQLTGLVGKSPTPEESQPRSVFEVHAGGGDGRAYARRALESEIGRLLLTPAGERNNALNKAAFSLGGLVAAGLILRQEVETALTLVGQRIGLESGEIARTIRSGLDAGEKEPRKVPERNGYGNFTATATPALDRLTICASKVEPKVVDWLWKNRIPKRFITVFAGRTGLGKSFVTCDLAARISVGGEMPCSGGECFEPGNTLLISEDPYDYVLAPRLIEAGADLNRIHFLTWEAMLHYTLENIEFLERAYQEAGSPKLLAIDPPTNFLGARDEHKNSEVRSLLMKLVNWLKDRDIACVLITHVNKNSAKGIEALNRVIGSVAWTTTSRIAHSFAPDPERKGGCLVIPMKNNLGQLAKGLAYQIEPTDSLARVVWHGEVETTADEAFDSDGSKKAPRRVVAAQWLVERFRERREWPGTELFDQAKREGISRNAIYEAKKSLDFLKARKVTEQNGDEHWVWWVPDDWEQLPGETPG